MNIDEQDCNENFYARPPNIVEIEDASFAVRVFGEGPALLFIHGYPVHGYTWRKLIPTLAESHTCYVIDLPGLGDSEWTPETDFGFVAQARRLSGLLGHLGIEQCSIVSHDTGATIARLLALLEPDRIGKLAIINTEMPGHRPPWIQLYQLSTYLPLHKLTFRLLLGNKWFVRSSMGLAEFYSDKSLLDDPENIGPYLAPLVNSPRRLDGMLSYLKGIDWKAVDSMQSRHKNIQAEVLLIWGEDDNTFPVELGEQLVDQFVSACSFKHISGASLMPHEEKPEQVLHHLIPFLSNG